MRGVRARPCSLQGPAEMARVLNSHRPRVEDSKSLRLQSPPNWKIPVERFQAFKIPSLEDSMLFSSWNFQTPGSLLAPKPESPGSFNFPKSKNKKHKERGWRSKRRQLKRRPKNKLPPPSGS